jgi:hypothetical protein
VELGIVNLHGVGCRSIGTLAHALYQGFHSNSRCCGPGFGILARNKDDMFGRHDILACISYSLQSGLKF